MKERMINRGDLFYYDFGNRVGSVQSGERPVLVVQADDYKKNAPTVIVAAVTSVIKKRSRTFCRLQIQYQ
ncbi:mRNA interferase EndoA [uncultured Eubacterium sp.]|uniref:type II toxin-antitoxin system PemK/MazF family toxin n=1 Tax=Brotomerdimonas butyrica TaxID=2981721 RepID=UPI0008232DF4|nr:type II toxin-antitoxin system PemK/MazF family toxin [Brotomerdimonas butyrica]SCI02659.1 mRNA interferase EndoA [uncultured Eubacterium sp.]